LARFREPERGYHLSRCAAGSDRVLDRLRPDWLGQLVWLPKGQEVKKIKMQANINKTAYP